LTTPNVANGFIGSAGGDRSRNNAFKLDGVAAAATGQNVGELFEYKVDHPVSIKRNSSALIPIVSSKVDGERVSIFNEAAGMKNPMSGVLLHNSTGLTLEFGPLTVYEGETYAGEGLLDRMKPDEKRYLTYAADLGCLISSNLDFHVDKVHLVVIANGYLYTHNKEFSTRTYTIVNKGDKPKVVILEHPKRNDYTLKDPKEPFETTENFYRFRVEVAPKSTLKFPVVEESEKSISYSLLSLTDNYMELFVNQRYINEEVRQTLKKLLDLKQQIAAIEQEIKTKNQQISEINSDQARIRENLKAVGKSEEERKLVARYTQKFNETEDELEKLRKEIKALQESKEKLDAEATKIILSLSYENKLQN
jgi:hypothetical protein